MERSFFTSLIDYVESNHLPINVQCQMSIISETEHVIMFNNILYCVVDKTVKTFDNKIALCFIAIDS